jgi:hypothetical protein
VSTSRVHQMPANPVLLPTGGKRRAQYHGEIQSASPAGIRIELHGVHAGRTWNMPPDLDSISLAKPGRYSLHSTGELIEDPDLVSTWRITEPNRH